jgi:cytochrome c556
VAPSTTTTTVPSSDRCAQLVAARQRFNADVDRLGAALRRSLTGAQLQTALAQLEASRAAGNRQFDAALAACNAA